MDEPTAEMCTASTPLAMSDGRTGYATWYPQMGGYVAKCIAIQDAEDGCWDVYVWHDGDFPFAGDEQTGASQTWQVTFSHDKAMRVQGIEDMGVREHREPRKLHHCDPGQFIAFGRFLEERSRA